jgi:hypothetical protein
MQKLPVRAVVLSLTLFLLLERTASTEIIYDNSQTGGTNFFPSLNEFGDEIRLDGTSRVVQEFIFEYYGEFTGSVNPTARVRFYKNDGPGQFPEPGTLLYDSGDFPIDSGLNHHRLSGIAIDVPDNFTWTVEFKGLSGVDGEQAGLLFRDPPSIGESFDDFWMRTSNGWALFQSGSELVSNFGARVIGIPISQTLSIRRDGATLVLEWPAELGLYTAAQVNGPWYPAHDSTSPWSVQLSSAPRQFWAAFPPDAAPAAPLRLGVAGDQLVLEWGGSGILQVATEVIGPYEDVPGASSPFSVSREAGQTLFWRLRN